MAKLHSQTGPVTAAGKETSSRNATTHGGTSEKLIFAGECREDFDKLLEDLHTNPPQLLAALDECGKRRAVLVIARLDRLAREWRTQGKTLRAIAHDLNRLPPLFTSRLQLSLF